MNLMPLIIILAIFVALSAFFSACETAFTSLNRVRVKMLADEGSKRATKALLIYDNFNITITTLLICNNIVNIAAATVGTLLVFEAAPNIKASNVALISTILVTVVILIFGEVLPKSFAREKSDKYVLSVSGIVFVMIKVLKPISLPIMFLNKLVTKSYSSEEASVTEDELKAYIDAIEEEGVIEEEEGNLVRSVLDLDETTIGEILTPRTEIAGIDVTATEEEVLDIIFKEKYSRLPLYEDSLDNVIGLIYERDILVALAKNKGINLREQKRVSYFVPKSMKAASLLRYLQEHNAHMAIVIDEFGGTCGLITMEDLLEEIVGEIWDEHDEIVNKIIEKDSYYIISHDQSISEFFDKYLEGEVLPETEYSGFGGWIYDLLEVIPSLDDKVVYEGNKFIIEMKVIEIDGNRVEKLKVEIIEKFDENSSLKI